MKYNSSQNRGGRRNDGNRGPRHSGGHSGDRDNQGGQGGPRRNRERSNYGTRETTPAPKPTLWQKIVALFAGKKTTSVSSPAPQRARSEHPAYRGGETQVRTESRYDSRAETRADSRSERSSSAPDSAPRTPRKPEIIEVTSPKLYIGNLSFEAAESDLFDLFNGVGKVRNAEVVSNPHTHKSKGFAFVLMETVDEAKRAVVELHDKEFMGRKLVVSGAKTSDRPERAEA